MKGAEAGTEAETTEEYLVLVVLPLTLGLTCFSYIVQPHLQRMTPPTIGLALPHQLAINKMPHRYPTGQSNGRNSQLRFSLSKSVRMTTEANQY